jgi:hypothetical protein
LPLAHFLGAFSSTSNPFAHRIHSNVKTAGHLLGLAKSLKIRILDYFPGPSRYFLSGFRYFHAARAVFFYRRAIRHGVRVVFQRLRLIF